MEGVVLHLYGFVLASLRLPWLTGIDPETAVFLIPCGDVSCAVSRVREAAYAAPAAGDDSDPTAWLTARALRHHNVITQLHAAGGVLPLKFGTICRDEADVRSLLADLHDTLTNLLVTVAQKDEWTLKISADPAAIAERRERESPAFAALRQAEAAMPEGRAYFARKQRAQAAATGVAAWLAVLDDAICERLAQLAVPVIRTERAGSGGIRDTALLVDRGSMDGIAGALAALQDEHAWCGLSFALSGPWAPYSFVPALDRPHSVGK